jgi:uncharacterized protein (DUF488 family)
MRCVSESDPVARVSIKAGTGGTKTIIVMKQFDFDVSLACRHSFVVKIRESLVVNLAEMQRTSCSGVVVIFQVHYK